MCKEIISMETFPLQCGMCSRETWITGAMFERNMDNRSNNVVESKLIDQDNKHFYFKIMFGRILRKKCPSFPSADVDENAIK